MSDNGSSENNSPEIGAQPQEQSNKIIFVAKLDQSKEVVVDIFSKYVPILSYASNLLRIEIDKLIINQAIERAQDKSKIIKSQNIPHKIIDFIRRGR